MEGKITELLQRRLKGITKVVEQQAQNLRDKFNSERQVGQRETYKQLTTIWELQVESLRC
jgi:hypothetical protein